MSTHDDPPGGHLPSAELEAATTTRGGGSSEEGPTAAWHPHDDSEPRPGEEGVPSRFGRYRILRLIGEGGMGTVYEARQDQPKRTVALKVIRSAGLPAIRLKRFELESQLLARLQHPGIAQVYDAGTVLDDYGRALPYYAMELIHGVSLRKYADDRRLGTRARLDLIAKICDAVGRAHQRGVIHRDLKPANILVEEGGHPRVLDFGVARATDADDRPTTLQTDMGQLLGTLPYMSPEQASGNPDEVDSRSDIYALGVVAYELLAGRLPYAIDRNMIPEAVRVIQQVEPVSLSSHDRSLRGDVETLILKALEKEKTRRYATAEDFAADIRRYLNNEPITARRASAGYRAWKFAQRHKVAVGALAAVIASLVVALVVTTRQASAARRERDRAAVVAEFMAKTLEGIGPSVAVGRDATMLKEMMDAAASRIEKGELKGNPGAELTLRSTIGGTYRELADFKSAHRMLDAVSALAQAPEARNTAEAAAGLSAVALLAKDESRLEEAEAHLRSALAIQRALGPGAALEVALTQRSLANVLAERGRPAEAEPLLRDTVAVLRRSDPTGSDDLAVSLNDLAQTLTDLERPDEVESLYRESLALQRKLHQGDYPEIATTLNNLAVHFKDRGRLKDAIEMMSEALAMNRRLLRGDHPFVAGGINNLASLLESDGRRSEAEPLYRESLAMRRRLFDGDHAMVAGGLNNLALVLQRQGKLAEAEPLFRESLAMRQRLFKGDHPSIALDMNNLALLLRDKGQLEASQTLARDAIAMQVRTQGPDAWLTGYARHGRGRTLTLMKRFKEAEQELVEAERVLAMPKTPAGRHAKVCETLADLYDAWNKADPRGGHAARATEWRTKFQAETSKAAKGKS